MLEPETVLLVNGIAYGGWVEVDIRLDAECLANTFDVKASEEWPDDERAPELAARAIQVDDAVEVRLDGVTVITGYIDDVDPDYDMESRWVRIRGRDKTGDLVDCSAIHAGGQWQNQKLDAIARDLCKPFGIAVAVATDVGEPFPTWQIQEGETVNDNLQRAARQRGVMLIADGLGGLTITRASKVRLKTAIELGVNPISASGSRSHRERFSEYRIVGQQPMSDEVGFDSNATEVAATSKDSAVKRYRPLVVVADDNVSLGTAKERADWERNVRAGRALKTAHTLDSWKHAEGIWRPNCRVPVRDSWLRIDQDLFISSVQLSLSDRGYRAIVATTIPAAFDRIALPEPSEEPLQ